MNYIPYVIEQSGHIERSYDIFSRLLKDRIIFIGTEINDQIANVVSAELLFLEADDPDKDIFMYINSPGGTIHSGLAIYDTMQYVKPDVCTTCLGLAASMAAVLLAAGAKGKRTSLPNSRIMIHQPFGGGRGPAADIEIMAKEIVRARDQLADILAKKTSRTRKQILTDIDRDKYMSPDEAKEYGLIDAVILTREEHKK
ncbi:MAG: ATP-dependent Clp protease proteolytic subunit [Candidatus Latescibacteria bacterium]|nr:ATP-dependent Clp protease proteolytic subunit [Candidatus Latescibacterota bacterium]